MEKLIVATKNKGKMKEIRALLSRQPYKVLSMEEADLDAIILEDGSTFEENALKKAEAIYQMAGVGVEDGLYSDAMILSDDSGLAVDALDGAPGILSARYGGPELNDKERYELLLKNLEGVPYERRTARFICSVVLLSADKKLVVRGTLEGYILDKPRGNNGFGYDPVFFVPAYGKSAAELCDHEKNFISHRAQALQKIVKALSETHASHP